MMGRSVRVFPHQDLPWLGHGSEAARHRDGFSERRQLRGGTVHGYDGEACAEPKPDLEIGWSRRPITRSPTPKPACHCQCALRRSPGMVLAGRGGAKGHNDPIASKLNGRASKIERGGADHFHACAHELQKPFRVEPSAQPYIDRQNCYQFAFALDRIGHAHEEARGSAFRTARALPRNLALGQSGA